MSDKTDDFDLTALAAVVLVPLIGVLLIPILLWNGWAASTLWGWFIVPTFNAPAISITQAAGVALVVGVFRAKISSPKDEMKWSTRIVAIIIGPPISVGLGWVIKWLGT